MMLSVQGKSIMATISRKTTGETKTPSKALMVYMSPAEHKRIRIEAINRGLTASALVMEAVRAHLPRAKDTGAAHAA